MIVALCETFASERSPILIKVINFSNKIKPTQRINFK